MSDACRECREDLEHCHGTVILHSLSAAECTEDCGTPETVHAHRIDCDAVGCVCTATISVSVVS